MRERLEMLDGRVFYSDDGWLTVWQFRGADQSPRRVRGKEADKVRFLVIAQSSAGP